MTSATPTTVSLAWDPSTDNVGVAFYYMYLDARRTRVEGTTYTASNLECGQSLGVSVVAYDFARNRSLSATATVSTAACVDTQPPLPPVGFRQAATTETAVVLEWDESLDDVGVVEYGVYRNQLPVQSPSQPTATLTGLYCGSTFEYQVDAADAAGNRSQRRSAWVQTARCSDLPPPVVDSRPPSQPANLAISSVTVSSVSLTWSPSTDNVGVAGYDVYKNGTKMASVSSTSSTQGGLDCGTSYWFGVEAFDGAGNRSDRARVNATTSACLPTLPPPPTVPPPPPPDNSPPADENPPT
ncbi:MAG: fibronectin type III domain-containing protein, partial [Chloroflexi bacterium]|nr:fibronectin type III domain-containing protein [Chloroflexota bacterium]